MTPENHLPDQARRTASPTFPPAHDRLLPHDTVGRGVPDLVPPAWEREHLMTLARTVPAGRVRRSRLPRFLWVVPALAVAAAVGLVAVSLSTQG
ncbi:hypothetical protein [Nocardioides bruguierae]|uniref:Uncharacterized protein n=1 Tax=Nocardioides bruguierae TaxID=2945102 RepID=A0A9X2IH18_9ACTN|nr:hypothetical protein [Nocardioides bruguierae]MCM0622149.1 hypothetical protein [Nocardioides bruguierae]